MRELPMLLNGHGVRATLERRKTQTRRPVKPQPPEGARMAWACGVCAWELDGAFGAENRNPLGVPGDLLYVRETARARCYGRHRGKVTWVELLYQADDEMIRFDRDNFGPFKLTGHWTPSIHMPKWAARLWARNTGVRVEKGPYISEEDAVAEGFEGYTTYHTMPGEQFVQEPYDIITPAEEFMEWWERQYPGVIWRGVTEYEVIER